jgi:anti-sigma B factor antagonist
MVIKTRDIKDIVVFDIEGEIRRTETAETTLHQNVKSLLDSGKRKYLLNLEKVEFIDSFGVGEILASFISIQNLGGRLKLSALSKRIQLVFQVTGLDKVLDISETLEAALEAFPRS